MMQVVDYTTASGRDHVGSLLASLRLCPSALAFGEGELAQQSAVVREVMQNVARSGDAALVEVARKYDDPAFESGHIRIDPEEIAAAHARTAPELLAAIRRSIMQVRQYQQHIMPPAELPALTRQGLSLSLRFTPLDSVGLYVPGGKAAYPSSLIMLAVPAQVAGVKRIAVCTPPSKFGRSDLLLAAAHELGLTELYRIGGAAAIAALAFGTSIVAPVDKITGPGNNYVQLAKRLVSGAVGIDGFAGPSEILTLADDTADPDIIAADLLAQAEHDPGSCFLLSTSKQLIDAVAAAVAHQLSALTRADAIKRALAGLSAAIYHPSMHELVELASAFAAEHVNIQARDADALARKLRHAGAVFIGSMSAVAAGDYVAGPSHCLPTNTTAKFASGCSVFEFLKRSSLVKYDAASLATDASAIVQLAAAEHLDAHAASITIRQEKSRTV